MSEPTIATGDPADLVEQMRELEPEDEPEEPTTLAPEADPADALEQTLEIGYGEEHDEEP